LKRRSGVFALAVGWLAGPLVGCQSPSPRISAAAGEFAAEASKTEPEGVSTQVRQRPQSQPGARGRILARNERVLVYLTEADDTLPAIAARFLGSPSKAWLIAQANAMPAAPMRVGSQGQTLVLPLSSPPPWGVAEDSFQTVPILCYHRFGSGSSKMIVQPAQFEAQLDWLQANGYSVLPLRALGGFLAGQDALPARSVVITIDDGYESVHRHAFPALKRHGYPATLFVYTDFIGARDGLSWAQLEEMARSGLIDVQAHSKTHRNLVERSEVDGDAAYRQGIETELKVPRAVLEKGLASAGVKVRHMAFPFGDANQTVLDALQRNDYDLGLTVNPGGNPFYAHPLMLRRTMIFGDHTLEDFKARLQVQRSFTRP
jgi:peptidoglycan/xylan/chitin deacetylase (PgdA/CDA1 family)